LTAFAALQHSAAMTFRTTTTMTTTTISTGTSPVRSVMRG
jgi:hypothetical protein